MSWNFDGAEKERRSQWDVTDAGDDRRVSPPSRLPPLPPAPVRSIRQTEPASIALTVIISLLFGVFGVIPAVIHSDRAKALGAPTRKYWAAFLIPMACWIFLWFIVIVASIIVG